MTRCLDDILKESSERLVINNNPVVLSANYGISLYRQYLVDADLTKSAYSLTITCNGVIFYYVDFVFDVSMLAPTGGITQEYSERVATMLATDAVVQISLSGLTNMISFAMTYGKLYYKEYKESEENILM